MKNTKIVIFFCLSAVSMLVLYGCGKKADENKPISQVKTEAEKMSTSQLRSMATKYKDAIMAKKGDAEKLADKLKDVPVTKILGEEAKSLKVEIDDLTKSVSALKERFEIYYQKLKEKGGNLAGLEL